MISRQRPTLPRSFPRSTIGAEGLNFRVRDGNGCDPFAMATEKLDNYKNKYGLEKEEFNYGQAARPISNGKLKTLLPLHIRPINLVVSEGPLGTLQSGISNLEVGFPLRCFQRLSLPNIATQRCPWRDNWHTRGSSIPVLSY